MSGRQIEKQKTDRKFGLITRLNSHASGRPSGDQFCVYVASRLVIPSLKYEQLPLFGSGELKLDSLTKQYIHDHLEYQFILVNSSAEAYETEIGARNGSLFRSKALIKPAAHITNCCSRSQACRLIGTQTHGLRRFAPNF